MKLKPLLWRTFFLFFFLKIKKKIVKGQWNVPAYQQGPVELNAHWKVQNNICNPHFNVELYIFKTIETENRPLITLLVEQGIKNIYSKFYAIPTTDSRYLYFIYFLFSNSLFSHWKLKAFYAPVKGRSQWYASIA